MSEQTTPEAELSRFVDREVRLDVTSLIRALARNAGFLAKQGEDADLQAICDRASEASAPIPDHAAAAIDAGWSRDGSGVWGRWYETDAGDKIVDVCDTAREACEMDGLTPPTMPVAQLWAVSPRLADQLARQGELITRDIEGLHVWSRTMDTPLDADPALVLAYRKLDGDLIGTRGALKRA